MGRGKYLGGMLGEVYLGRVSGGSIGGRYSSEIVGAIYVTVEQVTTPA